MKFDKNTFNALHRFVLRNTIQTSKLYKEADALNTKLLNKEIYLSDLPQLVNKSLSQKIVDYWSKYFHTGFEAKTKKDLGDFGGTFSRINNKRIG